MFNVADETRNHKAAQEQSRHGHQIPHRRHGEYGKIYGEKKLMITDNECE